MILLDANVLLYAYDSSSRHHRAARRFLARALQGPEPVRLPWVSALAFLRVATNARALERPLSVEEAIEIVDELLKTPACALLGPGDRHWEILRRLLPASQSKGPLVMDAHLAALALEHGATIATSDRDFSRFEGVRRVDPTAGG